MVNTTSPITENRKGNHLTGENTKNKDFLLNRNATYLIFRGY